MLANVGVEISQEGMEAAFEELKQFPDAPYGFFKHMLDHHIGKRLHKMKPEAEIKRDAVIHDLFIAQEILRRELSKRRYDGIEGSGLVSAVGLAAEVIRQADIETLTKIWEVK